MATSEGWQYLAGVLDLCSREVVGYAMGARMTTELVQKALVQALKRRLLKRDAFIIQIGGASIAATGISWIWKKPV